MKIEMNRRGPKLAAMAGLLGVVGFASVASADTLSEIIKGGKTSLDVRTRYEYIDTPGSSDINGYSVRTRLGLTTAELNGWKAMFEVEDVSFLEDDNRPGLDVPTTEINQLWLGYKDEDLEAKLGTQVYTLDDHRFIGHVGWRQNIQTFDALSTAFSPSAESAVKLTYLSRVNRINATAQDLDGILVNGSYKVSGSLNLTGFAYLLDFDSAGWAKMSTDTYGLRATGKIDGDSVDYNYAFSYATQAEGGDHPGDISLSYLAADISAAFSGLKLGLGYESLEGDGTYGFTTPLATVHKFNGFADVFAGRSIGLAGGLPQGLEDLYVSASYKFPVGKGLPMTLIYHEFDAENVGGSLGTEIDLVTKYALNDYTTLVAKYAYYDADSGNTVGYGAADASVFTFEANFKF